MDVIARKIFKAGADIIDSQNINTFLYLSKLCIHKDEKILSSSPMEGNDNKSLMGTFIKEVIMSSSEEQIKYFKDEYFEFTFPRIPSRGKRISRECVRRRASVYGSECDTYDLFADENIIKDPIGHEDSSDDYCDKEEIAKLQKSFSLNFSYDCNISDLHPYRTPLQEFIPQRPLIGNFNLKSSKKCIHIMIYISYLFIWAFKDKHMVFD